MNFTEVISKVLIDLFFASVIVAFYMMGKISVDYFKPQWKAYLAVITAVSILSLISWASYGTHTEDADPLFGGGEVVIDFEATRKERNEHLLKVFLTLVIPALIGVYRGHREMPDMDEDNEEAKAMSKKTFDTNLKVGILLTTEDGKKQIGIIEFSPTGMLIFHVIGEGLHVFALKPVEKCLKENGLEMPLYVKYANLLKQQRELPPDIIEKEAVYYTEVLNRLEPPVTIREQKIKAVVMRY